MRQVGTLVHFPSVSLRGVFEPTAAFEFPPPPSHMSRPALGLQWVGHQVLFVRSLSVSSTPCTECKFRETIPVLRRKEGPGGTPSERRRVTEAVTTRSDRVGYTRARAALPQQETSGSELGKPLQCSW